jgi:hypothetical protein
VYFSVPCLPYQLVDSFSGFVGWAMFFFSEGSSSCHAFFAASYSFWS